MIRLAVEHGRLALAFEKLSDEQAPALASDREIVVSAGAGAGKTSTLAARFVTLLQARIDGGAVDIGDVLVLTFTEKAAQEMKERCYRYTAAIARALRTEADRLGAAGLSDAAIRRYRAAWEGLRDRFAGAAISTFHGFCARVLREFPAETRTPPGFDVLEQDEATQLGHEAAAAAVDARVATDDPALALLLRAFRGRAGLVGQVATLLARRGELADALVEARTADVDALLARARPTPGEVRAFLEGPWPATTDRLLATCAGVETDWLGRLRAFRPRVDDLPKDPLHLYELYRAALDVYCSGKGFRSLKHHTATGAKALWGPRWTESRAAIEDLQGDLAAWAPRLDTLAGLPTRHDRTMVDVLRALSDVALDAMERHEAALRARQAVDFAALQLRVREAFADPTSPVVTELRRRHRYLMVDEFQDTDGLQWSIVQALARPEGMPGDRLFLVGDVKQAIYGFRGGDVQVFEAARRSVPGEVVLRTNYRSRPELIAWFNRLFADVLGPPGDERPPWEAAFAPLAAGRRHEGGTVRVATYPDGGDAVDDAAREARWIVHLLGTEVLPEAGVYAGSDLAASATPPVAILLRRRRHLPAYEAALRDAGIAYVVVGGVGFWSRPEVVDVANLLHALARRDPLSKVAALRSPLFGLTDTQIHALHRAKQLGRFGLAPLDLPPELHPAAALWRELATLVDHLPLSELVHHVLRRTRQAWVQGLAAPGGRGAANLERLLAMADAHEQAGGTLDAFAERLLARVEDDAQDAEATMPTTRARVAILTVHASKGLEYPVVVVPDMGAGRRGGGDAGVLARRVHDRWALACRVPDLYGDVDGDASPGALSALQAHAAAMEAAESRRLLYVACTRAMDHLVLVGRTRAKGPPEQAAAASWADMVHAHLASADGAADAAGSPGAAPWLTVEDISAFEPAPPPALAAPVLPPPTADDEARVATIHAPRRVDVSPSSLGLFERSRTQWADRYVHGIPNVGNPGGRDDLGVVAASVRGTVIHGLLEDDYLDDDDTALARWQALARTEGLPEAAVEAGWAEVRAQLRVLRESADVAAFLRAPGYAELPVRLVQGAVTLEGRIDRLCRDPEDGAWIVVDYKSVRVDGDEAAQLAEFRLQLLAYTAMASRVLEAQGEGRVARAGLLFTRTGRLSRLPDWTPADFEELHGRLAEVAEALRTELPEG